ncbi:MAG TPA: DUF1501 domain-containing protein, partial [Pirellulaceae bacterium]|nr:DUF1501 domain-containing protein [Pirellulaceae bacterium]
MNPFSLSAIRLLDRRRFLSHTMTGLGSIALVDLLNRDGKLAPHREGSQRIEDQSDRTITHHAPAAKRVVMVYCTGAISHLDTFDYKPLLFERDGQRLPGAENLKTFQGSQGNLTRPLRDFRPRGESGKMTSDLLPELGSLADEFCFLHGMTSRTNTHGPGETFMSTGFTLDGFPSLGAWVNYALGSENDNLPAFVAIPDPRGNPQAAGNNWGAAFLPARYQGVPFNAQRPVRFLHPEAGISASEDRATREFLQRLNRRHLERFPGDENLAARLASYELAARMQQTIPQLMDMSDEPEHILHMYGADQVGNPVKTQYARNCILARRLCERGVRFVQLFNGAYAMGEGVGNWDGHKELAQQYPGHAEILDQPTAALFRDLKQRGLLADTLFVFCTEFGRMPTFQAGASGRDHNPDGFTCLLAGAGVKSPLSWGATDEFGWKAIENITTVYDFHATILHLLGLDHERLTFYHNGSHRRLTDVHG